jgi:uncharacterized protein (DUF1499 family)
MTEHENSQSARGRARGKKLRWRVVVLSLVLLLLGGLILGNWFAGRPKSLGATDGKLAGCPDSPNCVCSQETRDSHHIAALAYEGDGKAAFSRLADVLESWPRIKIVTQTENYMHVEFTTRILRFVDDVEFLLAEDESVIHVRSASRVGYSDMGTNRKRVEAIRAAFAAENGNP